MLFALLCCLYLIAHDGVQHFVLLYVFTFLVPWYHVRYDCRIITMFDSSLPLVVCMTVWFVHRICLRVVVSNTIWLFEQHVRCFVRGGNCFLSRSLGFTSGFWWVRSANYVSTFGVLLCVCALFFFVLCLVCQMSILDCSVGVLYRLLLHSSEVVLHVVTVFSRCSLSFIVAFKWSSVTCSYSVQ